VKHFVATAAAAVVYINPTGLSSLYFLAVRHGIRDVAVVPVPEQNNRGETTWVGGLLF